MQIEHRYACQQEEDEQKREADRSVLQHVQPFAEHGAEPVGGLIRQNDDKAAQVEENEGQQGSQHGGNQLCRDVLMDGHGKDISR